MSEQKPQSRYVPLRVRFRSPTEQGEREHTTNAPAGDEGTVQHVGARTLSGGQVIIAPSSTGGSGNGGIETRQIKELLRLGNVLRAELGLREILQQMVASISSCVGFRICVIHLAENGNDYLSAGCLCRYVGREPARVARGTATYTRSGTPHAR